jgi:hypothetical protein
MHTDEYEISLSREFSLCRRSIKRLQKAIAAWEARYGMSTESFLENGTQDGPAGESRDFRNWRKDHAELQHWQQMLAGYEKALQMVKGM